MLFKCNLYHYTAAREVSSYRKFNEDVPFTADLSSVLNSAPTFPVLPGGGAPFAQTKEFLFMDMCCADDVGGGLYKFNAVADP